MGEGKMWSSERKVQPSSINILDLIVRWIQKAGRKRKKKPQQTDKTLVRRRLVLSSRNVDVSLSLKWRCVVVSRRKKKDKKG